MMQGGFQFWDYMHKLQSKNSLLNIMESHFNEDRVHQQLEAGMEEKLSKKVNTK